MQQLNRPSQTTFHTLSQRDSIHDLRSRLGIVTSAEHVLEHDPDRTQRIALLEAIEDAAMRGAQRTTDLITRCEHAGDLEIVDVGRRLYELAPMMNALAGSRIQLDLHIACRSAFARIDTAEFDATILELIANAAAAEAGMITVRIHKAGLRLWILVGDDGRGMAPVKLAQSRLGAGEGKPRASLSCVRHFVDASHGQLKIRSRRSGGTMAGIILPTVLSVVSGAHPSPQNHALSSPKKRLRERSPR